jgi:DNA polymerase (family 10)
VTVRNDELAGLLEEFADLLEAKDVEYKPRAYRLAAENVRDHPESVADLAREEGESGVAEINRVGDAIASKVVEYVETGEIAELAELREELPVEMGALTRIEGVGPKTVGRLYEALGVRTLEDIESAARAGEIQEVSGFGPKTEQNILEGVEFARQSGQRQLLGDAHPLAESIVAHFGGVEAVERCETAGSLRRWKPTIGDVDVLAAGEDAEAVVDAFRDWEDADELIEAGTSKASVRAKGTRVDLRVVAPGEFGAALQYFTGSKDHNIALRNYAIERGMKINEYGAFDVSDIEDPDAGQRVGELVAGETEAAIYGALELPWIPPELRENRGEIAAAAEDDLPALVSEEDIRGDLHTHTDASDGRETVAGMIEAAAERGDEYIAVTDHATGPGVVAGVGLEDGELLEHADRVRAAAADADADLTVFTGVEANIAADGSLSVADEVLAELDCVVASPHAALDGDGTDRLVRAVEHPEVDVLGHPTGRQLNSRAGLDVEFDRLAAAAADAGTALEVNANPSRLDLRGGAVAIALEHDATVAVNTDAHAPTSLDYRVYGVHTARRGWAETADVLNARAVEGVREFLG